MSNTTSEFKHVAELEEVKRQVKVSHKYYDHWIYSFLENKKWDVNETVAKLHRRETMEKEELANHSITDLMRENMRNGTLQFIGDDKEGRCTIYIVTARDFPKASQREERKKSFDMWMTYATRLRENNLTCKLTMLINQKDASVWSNTDMSFQAAVALRIAKYYPEAVEKLYVCCMSRALSALAKPIISKMPSTISDRVSIFSDKDVKDGKLLRYFDHHVLPVALGGQNDCDYQSNWNRFAATVEEHFVKVQGAIHRGLSVKDFELAQLNATSSSLSNDSGYERSNSFECGSSPQRPSGDSSWGGFPEPPARAPPPTPLHRRKNLTPMTPTSRPSATPLSRHASVEFPPTRHMTPINTPPPMSLSPPRNKVTPLTGLLSPHHQRQPVQKGRNVTLIVLSVLVCYVAAGASFTMWHFYDWSALVSLMLPAIVVVALQLMFWDALSKVPSPRHARHRPMPRLAVSMFSPMHASSETPMFTPMSSHVPDSLVSQR